MITSTGEGCGASTADVCLSIVDKITGEVTFEYIKIFKNSFNLQKHFFQFFEIAAYFSIGPNNIILANI